jgi:heme exporter protein D
MNWKSFDDFVHMGGYGLYVWGSYGLALAVLVIEPLLAARRHRRSRSDAARAAAEHAGAEAA